VEETEKPLALIGAQEVDGCFKKFGDPRMPWVLKPGARLPQGAEDSQRVHE